MSTLADRGEGALIALVRSLFRENQPLEVGIGDDGAVFRQPGPIVAVADAMVEDVHFSRVFCPPRAVGRKLVAVNVSDIAAMGATPTVALFTASLPRDLPWSWVVELIAGVAEEANTWDVTVAGGDVTGSPGPVGLSFSLLGQLVGNRPLLRSSAAPGDTIFVTGPLGGAGLGLRALQRGDPNPGRVPGATARHLTPSPRLAAGIALGRWDGAGACMDLSDGLAQDAPRMAAASNARFCIDLDAIPLHDEAVRETPEEALALALHGGEDYELLFTGRGDPPFGAVAIGKVHAGPAGVEWVRGRQRVSVPGGGFRHFGE